MLNFLKVFTTQAKIRANAAEVSAVIAERSALREYEQEQLRVIHMAAQKKAQKLSDRVQENLDRLDAEMDALVAEGKRLQGVALLEELPSRVMSGFTK